MLNQMGESMMQEQKSEVQAMFEVGVKEAEKERLRF